MSNTLFITGTDTEIGKTYYACRLLSTLGEQGYRVAAMKPVASGALDSGDGLRNEDALALQSAMNVDLSYDRLNPYCYPPAIAPHVAAQKAQQVIDVEVIKQNLSAIQSQADIVIVEGVGGWLVPLNPNQTVADLVRHLNIPVVLVVGIRLGCINHALLSAQAILQSGVRLLGWVANIVDAEMPVIDENIAAIQTRLPVPLLDTLIHDPTGSMAPAVETRWLLDE